MCLLNSASLPQVYLKEDNLVERRWGYWPGSHDKPLQDPSGSTAHSWKGFIGWWWEFMFWNFFLAYSIVRNKRNWYLRLTNITVSQSRCSDLWNTTQFWPFSFTWKLSPGKRPVKIPPRLHFSLLLGQKPESTLNMNWEAKSKARRKKKRITWRNLLNYIIINLGNMGRRVNFECTWPKRAECNFAFIPMSAAWWYSKCGSQTGAASWTVSFRSRMSIEFVKNKVDRETYL